MLDSLLGSQLGTTAKFAIAFLLVLALIGITAVILKRFGSGRMPSSGGGRNRQPRLAVLDSAIVDAKRRLVLIRRDNAEHLILIGGPTDVVVETNILRGSLAPGAQPMDRRPRPQPQELDSFEAALVPEPAYEEPAPRAAPAPRSRDREPAPRAQRPMPPQPQPEPVQEFNEPYPEPAAFSPPPPLTPRPAPAAHPAAAAPAPQPAPAPRNDPQYADMALKLEAALRKPAAAPVSRAPEPQPAAPAPQTRSVTPPTPPMPQTRPMPAAPAPATAQPAAPAPSKQGAPNPFDSLEAEMASLLGQDKKR
ncbi:MAG: FliO/MopB family protein [Xanthobacteraceae bacterium]|nr:FliO/MopB family protein [Xanthobacteraceae bacterium]